MLHSALCYLTLISNLENQHGARFIRKRQQHLLRLLRPRPEYRRAVRSPPGYACRNRSTGYQDAAHAGEEVQAAFRELRMQGLLVRDDDEQRAEARALGESQSRRKSGVSVWPARKRGKRPSGRGSVLRSAIFGAQANNLNPSKDCSLQVCAVIEGRCYVVNSMRKTRVNLH